MELKEGLFVNKMKALSYNAKCFSGNNLIEGELFFTSSSESIPDELKSELKNVEKDLTKFSTNIEDEIEAAAKSYEQKEISRETFLKRLKALRIKAEEDISEVLDSTFKAIIAIAKSTGKYKLMLNTFNRITLFVSGVVDFVQNLILSLISGIMGWANRVMDGFVNVARNIGNFFTNIFNSLEASSGLV
jgi:hypothetical protein